MNLKKNKTMKKVGKLTLITRNTPEGDELAELLEGMGLPETNDNVMIATFAYMLGQANIREKARAI